MKLAPSTIPGARWTPILLALLPLRASGQDAPVAPQGPQPEEPAESEPEFEESAFERLPRKLAPFAADWGVGVVVRSAQIPFKSENDTTSSLVPMLFYEGQRAFVRGMSAGVHAWKGEHSELNLLTRLRFVDIPQEFREGSPGDALDFGVQYHHNFNGAWWEAEALSDSHGKWYLSSRVGASAVVGDLLFSPSLELRYLTPGFTSRYFALTSVTGQSAGDALQLSSAVIGRYHVYSDLYLLGSLRYTLYSSEITGLDAIDRNGVAEATIGFGFFQDAGDPQFLGQPAERASAKRSLEAKPYVRLAHGWATPSNLGEILGGAIENDEFNNQVTTVFYGHPLTDTIFGAPIELYLSPGFGYHYSSSVQSNSPELILDIKAYYTIHWPIRWRLGLAEGVSWVQDVTYIERIDAEATGNATSEWMNYLDLSLDFNTGDLIRVESMKRLWAGVSIHHRSSIFETASQFGRLKGGSNYITFYLQYDLF